MLAKKPLTAKGIEALKPAPAGKRKLYYDSLVPGLAVRMTDKPTGKAFVLVNRFGKANPTARSLGLCSGLTLEAARDQARDWLKLIAQGKDPAAVAAQREAGTVKAVAKNGSPARATHFAQPPPNDLDLSGWSIPPSASCRSRRFGGAMLSACTIALAKLMAPSSPTASTPCSALSSIGGKFATRTSVILAPRE